MHAHERARERKKKGKKARERRREGESERKREKERESTRENKTFIEGLGAVGRAGKGAQ